MIKMKRIIAVWLVMIMLIGGTIGFVNLSTDAEEGDGDAEIRSASQSKSGLTPHAQISINGNDDFVSQAENESWAGNGTEGNPYIIENYDINASSADGIEIRNTDVYFIIKNCVIHDGKTSYNYGIYFHNVTYGKIENVSSYNNNYGIALYSSSENNYMVSCQIYNNYWYGICLSYSLNNTIVSCQIYNNSGDGTQLYSSLNNNISNCQIYSNSYGIVFYSSSDNNIMTACQIYNNSKDGIHFAASSNNNVTGCQISDNYDAGIDIWHSSNNEVHYNNIFNNSDYGVYCYDYGVNATHNWWGSADGPSGAGPGTGDNVSANVIYYPWLTELWTEVNQPPVADFTYSPISPTTEDIYYITMHNNGLIYFTDQSYDPDGNITAWFWEFGDNSTSTLQNPTHQYSVAGNYTVNLTVTDDDGATNTTSKEITITILDIGIITNISLTNFTIVNLSWLNISYVANITNGIIMNGTIINTTNWMDITITTSWMNITNLSIINISYINITNLMNISNMSFANIFEVTLTNFTYMSSSSFINVSYVNITQSMSINNIILNNVSYAYFQNISNVNFVITSIPNITTIAYENLQIVIPAEALNLSMPFNLSTTSVPLPPGYSVVGDIYRIECGVSIGAPINITLSYAGIVLPPGISEDDLAVYKKVGDNWIKIDSIIDKLNNTFSVQVTSFSDYAILYKQPSTEDGEESKPSAKPFDIPWLYIIIPVVIIAVATVAGIGIKRRKKALPPEKPAW